MYFVYFGSAYIPEGLHMRYSGRYRLGDPRDALGICLPCTNRLTDGCSSYARLS